MAEYRSNEQVNVSWGESFNIGVKAPVIAKRIFLTLGDAQDFVDDIYQSATPGLRISVLTDYVKDVVATYEDGHFIYVDGVWVTAEGESEGDTYTLSEKLSGVYYIKTIGDGIIPGELVKLGEGDGVTYSAGNGIDISNENVISIIDIDCGEY